jgi:stage III sporulation protein AA
LLATAHGSEIEDLHRRPAYRRLLDAGLFQQVILIQRNGRERRYRLETLS